ncbi:hypothetical protein HYS47_03930 [Candidatus Woesearchaeota archaeon]|nr:hypothetical protein [Candidatus Woesearchaeota archaeon]
MDSSQTTTSKTTIDAVLSKTLRELRLSRRGQRALGRHLGNHATARDILSTSEFELLERAHDFGIMALLDLREKLALYAGVPLHEAYLTKSYWQSRKPLSFPDVSEHAAVHAWKRFTEHCSHTPFQYAAESYWLQPRLRTIPFAFFLEAAEEMHARTSLGEELLTAARENIYIAARRLGSLRGFCWYKPRKARSTASLQTVRTFAEQGLAPADIAREHSMPYSRAYGMASRYCLLPGKD